MCALLCLVSFTEDNFLRFIYIITCISTSFLFVAKQYSTVYIYMCVCVCVCIIHSSGFQGGTNGKEPDGQCQCRRCKRHRFNPWV